MCAKIVSALVQPMINNFRVWPALEKNRSAYTQLILHNGFETDCNLHCGEHAKNVQVLGCISLYSYTAPTSLYISKHAHVRTSKFWRKSKEINRNFYRILTKVVSGLDLGQKNQNYLILVYISLIPIQSQGHTWVNILIKYVELC